MGRRLHSGCEICSRSPPTAWLRRRRKLQEVVRRHEECRTVFRDLRSEIKSGLVEVGDVFDSISVPLMKLVGLKVEEMAGDGKSSAIIISPELYVFNGFAERPAVSGKRCYASMKENSTCDLAGDKVNGFPRDLPVSYTEGASYSAQAKEACEEILEKQRLLAQRLVRLLRSIVAHLVYKQESIRYAFDYTHNSLRHFIKRAASIYSPPCVGHHPPQTQADLDATANLVGKVLHATYVQVSSSLDDVQQAVDNMLGAIAEATCGVMVSHVEQLLADAESGTLARLWALVGEMEGTISKLSTELAVARKRARMAEEEKVEAVTISPIYEQPLLASPKMGHHRHFAPTSRSRPPHRIQSNVEPTAQLSSLQDGSQTDHHQHQSATSPARGRSSAKGYVASTPQNPSAF